MLGRRPRGVLVGEGLWVRGFRRFTRRGTGPVVRFHNISGACRANARTLRSIGVGVGGNRFIFIMNSSNTNGDAFVGLVVHRRGTGANGVIMGNFSLAGVGHGSIPVLHEAVNVIFRSFELVPAVDIFSGITFTVRIMNTSDGRVEGRISGTLSGINLKRGTHSVPGRLSNNRRRHINLTHTLMGSPSLVVTSRPANGISPGVSCRVMALLARVGGGNAAVLVMARSRGLIHSFRRHIVVLSNNGVVTSGIKNRVW